MSVVRAYVRVSSQRQAEEGLSLDSQIERLRAAAGDGTVVVYREEGVSGRKASRPALDRLMVNVEGGDTVMVIALDRLGRSLAHVIETVKAIGEKGGQLVSLRENLDTSSPTGRFMFQIVGAFAELESGLIGERVRATRSAAKRKHGKTFGGLRPYGREPDGTIRHSEANVLRDRIVAPFLAGVPVRQIARDLEADEVPTAAGGKWRGPSITRMLKRADLCGLIEIDGDLEEGSVSPIIERDTWNRVRARFAVRATGEDTRGRHPAAPYLLDRPLDVRCGVCGGRIRARTVHRKDRLTLYRYVCVGASDRAVCSMSRFPREAVDAPLVRMFQSSLIDEKATLRSIEKAAGAVLADTKKALWEAEREARLAHERLARVRRHFSEGAITAEEWRSFADEIGSEREAARAEQERLRRHLADLEQESPIRDAQRQLHALLDEIRQLAEAYEPDDDQLVRPLRDALASIVDEILIHPLAPPENPLERPDTGRSVFLVSGGLLIEIVAKEVSPQPVTLIDGTIVHADLPHFEPVALDRANNEPFASMI